jgi:hypothetical protein
MRKPLFAVALALFCAPLTQAGEPIASGNLPLTRCESRELLQFNSGYTTPAFVLQTASSRDFPNERIVHIMSGSPSIQHRVNAERSTGATEITAFESGLSPRFMERSHGMWLSLRGPAEQPTEATLTLSARELENLQNVSIAHVGWDAFRLVNGKVSVELRCSAASE